MYPLILYLELQSLVGGRDVGTPGLPLKLILVLTVMRLQLVLVLILVLIVVQIKAALLVQVFSGHELCAFTGAPLGQLVHTVVES